MISISCSIHSHLPSFFPPSPPSLPSSFHLPERLDLENAGSATRRGQGGQNIIDQAGGLGGGREEGEEEGELLPDAPAFGRAPGVGLAFGTWREGGSEGGREGGRAE